MEEEEEEDKKNKRIMAKEDKFKMMHESINEEFYSGNDTNRLSLLYILFKYKIISEGTLIVAETSK